MGVPSPSPCRLLLMCCLVAGASSAAVVAGQSTPHESLLDRTLSAYGAGDHDVVARTFISSREFDRQHVTDARAFARWLGPWQPRKAAFVLELAAATTVVAPNWTGPIVLSGQRYVAARPNRGTASPAEDTFEQVWHRTALGLLQKLGLASYEEAYLAALRTPRHGTSSVALNVAPDDGRLLLAYGIAAEQRCWTDRPDLLQAGERADRVTRASGTPVTMLGSRSANAKARARQRDCLSDAAGRFDAATAAEEGGAEARVRGAWMRFQLGQYPEALRTIDEVDPGEDRELAYWAALFRGRIDDALGRQPDAERAYRAALAAWPDAQSAGVGLALTLFKLHRSADADAAALAVRIRSAGVSDPWWSYPGADQRFLAQWLALLRRARP